VFNSPVEGRNLLYRLVRDFNLCTELTALGPCSAECFAFSNDNKEMATCTDRLTAYDYNIRVQAALNYLAENLPTFALFDSGRNREERSCIWIEKGRFYAMGYLDQASDLRHAEDIRDALIRYEGNDYMLHLVQAYAQKYPDKVMRHTMEDNADTVYQDTIYDDL